MKDYSLRTSEKFFQVFAIFLNFACHLEFWQKWKMSFFPENCTTQSDFEHTLAPLDIKDYSFNSSENFRIFKISAAIFKNAVYLQNQVSFSFLVDTSCIWPQLSSMI